jgi:hypothetical protein
VARGQQADKVAEEGLFLRGCLGHSHLELAGGLADVANPEVLSTRRNVQPDGMQQNLKLRNVTYSKHLVVTPNVDASRSL